MTNKKKVIVTSIDMQQGQTVNAKKKEKQSLYYEVITISSFCRRINKKKNKNIEKTMKKRKKRETDAMEDWSGCSTEAAGVARLESKWDPLKVQETAVPPAVVEAGGGRPFPPFLLLTTISLSLLFFFSFYREIKRVYLLFFLKLRITDRRKINTQKLRKIRNILNKQLSFLFVF